MARTRQTGRKREYRATLFWLVVLVLAAGGWLWYAYGRPGTPPSAATASPSPSARPTGPPAGAQPVRVDFPLDGDSLQVTADQPGPVIDVTEPVQVRLLGIDAPELHGADGSPQCWADTARAELRRLAPNGSRLWLLPDEQRLDPYGRRLVYAWTTDGRFVNGELAARGAVRELAIRPNLAFQQDLHDAVEQARTERRGLWGSCVGR
ncbi:thermonuclease family protein [Catellatospora sp. NPDC049111]|uniref:thermonuclease family protein n=1 Tax=Catellatospora sp. NPDC049111 TaxID=3155271 RepID=UPI0033F6D6DB